MEFKVLMFQSLDGFQNIRGKIYVPNVLRTELAGWSLTSYVPSLKADWWLEGLGFNLCVAPFPNICVSNFKVGA